MRPLVTKQLKWSTIAAYNAKCKTNSSARSEESSKASSMKLPIVALRGALACRQRFIDAGGSAHFGHSAATDTCTAAQLGHAPEMRRSGLDERLSL